MRLSALILGILLLVPSVNAVGLMVPPVVAEEDVLDFRVNKTFEITFSLKGDGENHTLRFFVEPSEDGYMTVNNETMFSTTFKISGYEQIDIPVVFEGVEEVEDEFEVEYGFVYVRDNQTNSSVGFQQVTSSVFMSKVRCPDCDNFETQNQQNDAEETEDSGGSGGGSGGTGNDQDNGQDNQDTTDDTDNQDGQNNDAQIQDVTQSNSALNEGAVDDGTETDVDNLPTQLESTGSSPSSNAEGMIWNGLIILLLVGILAMAGYSYKLTDEVME